MLAGFIYLVVVIDLFSRKVLGWTVGDRLDAGLSTEALHRALARRISAPGLIFHSTSPMSTGLESTLSSAVASGITFDQQLFAEYGGVLAGYLAVVRRGLERPFDSWARQGTLGGMEPFGIWRALGGKPHMPR